MILKLIQVKYVSKIISVVQQDGIFALFRKTTRIIKLIILPYFDYPFDLKHGVDTCRVMFHNDASDLGPDEKKTALRYEATPVNAVRSILKELPIDHSEFTFIDYGSGKGRVLLLAAEYPFKRIIGVELSKKLHEIAQNNIKIWKYSNPKCTDIKLCHGDATQFKLPDDPLVIFFFAPFRGIVKDLVVSNIRESFNANPRPIHIVYYGIRTDFIEISSDMNINHQEIYSRHPLPASGDYKGHLFSFSTESPT